MTDDRGLHIERLPAGTEFVVSGDLDANTAYDVYLAAVKAAGPEQEAVTLDLAGVTFIDSTGLSMLLRAREELANDHGVLLRLRAPSARVQQMLALTALTSVFTVVGD